MADTRALGARAARHGGSTPSTGTKSKRRGDYVYTYLFIDFSDDYQLTLYNQIQRITGDKMRSRSLYYSMTTFVLQSNLSLQM